MTTVLIVDDHQHNRYLLRTILSAHGYQVLEAANGAEALNLARRTLPHLIISDILMPVMDGYSLCRECKRDALLQGIPFVFYTATYIDAKDEELGLRLGAVRFIAKPIEVDAFTAILQEALNDYGNGRLSAVPSLADEETTYFRLYNEVLVHQLEGKMLELKQANQALRESEERFRRLAENAQDLIYRIRTVPTRAFEYVSPAAFALTGYTVEEHYADGELGFKLVHPDDYPVLDAAVRGAIVSGQPITLRLIRKDGQVIWTEQRNVPIFDEAGNLVAIEGIARDVTARKQTEDALRASETALKRSQQIAHLGHWTWDTRTNFVKWSDEMYRVFGVDLQTFDGDLDAIIRRTIHPDDADRVFKMNEAVIQEGRSTEAEYRVVWPDGSIHDVWAMPGDQITDKQGAIVQLSGVVQDITERKRTEQMARLQVAALHAAANGIVITDINGNIQWVNPAFTAITGYSAEESRGHNPRELVRSGLQSEDYYRTLWETILAGRVWQGELINRRKNGTYYTEEQTITPVHDAQGKTTHFIGIKQDITARKGIEAERERLLVQLQAQAEQMTQIMHSVPEGVLLLDPHGRVILANPQAGAQLTLLAGITVGDTLTHLGDRSLETLLTSPLTGHWHLVQAVNRSFETIARPLESGPTPVGWVFVIRDVTQELAVQQQLQRQERLAAVGQLAAGIAHDFNNIMSVIVMYAQITVRAVGLTERDRARLVTIDQQAMRASQMIRQILDFSRRSVLERQTLDLLPLLKEQIKLLERTLPEHIEIGLVYAPGDYVVKADPTRMQQIFMNLAFNARDAMPDGGKLRFELAHFQAATSNEVLLPDIGAGTWIRLAVTDTGTGIAPAVLDHIFEPFFTTKEPGKGTGLGLAQVHGIVGQHDGHITVESQLGTGTTFMIYLPALAIVAAGDISAFALADLPRGEGQTILVVEDDSALRGTLVELLQTWGYCIIEATNGQEALSRLAEQHGQPNLVISDVVMPHMGGVGLFHALRRQGLEIPMILLTGHPLGEELAGLHAFGLYAALVKPPSAEQLAATIAAALRA